jgi:hypothetical protein
MAGKLCFMKLVEKVNHILLAQYILSMSYTLKDY